MTNDQDGPEPKPSWHRGYLEPRPLVNGIVASVLVLVVWNLFPAIVVYVFPVSISFVSRISASTIDHAYAGAVVDPLLPIFVSIFDTALVMVSVYVFVIAIQYGLHGEFRKRVDSQKLVEGSAAAGIAPRVVHSLLSLMLISLAIVLASIPALTLEVSITEGRRIMALEPYITDQEHKELIGQWGRVETKADFDRLMAAMEKLAADRHTTLPRRFD